MGLSLKVGLATTAIGLSIVVMGLRSAVAAGGEACTGRNYRVAPYPMIECSGDCPNGDFCDHFPIKLEADAGFWWVCACYGGGIYTPIDAPQCALTMHVWDTNAKAECHRQGCPNPCSAPAKSGSGWACPCAK